MKTKMEYKVALRNALRNIDQNIDDIIEIAFKNKTAAINIRINIEPGSIIQWTLKEDFNVLPFNEREGE